MPPPLKKPTTAPPPSTLTRPEFKLTLSDPGIAKGHRTILYGTGGIGKTTLAARLASIGPVAFIDWEDSLPMLRKRLEAQGVTIPQVIPVKTISDLRAMCRAVPEAWGPIKNVVLDSGSRLEEMLGQEVLRTIKGEGGHQVHQIEGYGYGKGYQHIFEASLKVLADLDALAKRGINVTIICHDCCSNVPNPEGKDWLRYEPRLQNPQSGKSSIRLRMKEWADHVLFYGYDVVVDKDGKAAGGGTKTIYTKETPFCMAKSRTVDGVYPIDDSTDFWSVLFNGE